MTSHLLLIAFSMGLGASLATAQVQVRIARGAQAVPVVGAANRAEEEQYGVRVELFENPNLDRFLRRAEKFLNEKNWSSAISVLQDVVEGRTLEVSFGEGEDAGGTTDGATPPSEGEGEGADEGDAQGGDSGLGGGVGDNELDASQAVFSRDGRIYHPVRRLCQGLLASMETAGIDLYRTRFELDAQALYEDAVAARNPAALESVYTRYFVTEAAGKALWAAGDLLMDQGRFRGAIQVYRDLLESYPDEFRRRLQIEDSWLQFKIALCLQLLGEEDGARQQLQALAEAFPDESLRLMGELETLSTLPESSFFESSTVGRTAVEVANGDAALIEPDTQALVPLWEFRFHDPEPYRAPRGQTDNNYFQSSKVLPKNDQFSPGTAIAFDGDNALFLDHNRLRIHDGLSGLMLREGEGKLDPPTPRQGQARSRVPVYDWATMQTVPVDDRVFVVRCNDSNAQRDERAVLRNQLVALDRETAREVWSSERWTEEPNRLDDVTFLAAPTVFGDKLMVPVLHRESYGLQCLRQEDGAPIWRTAIHAGGTPYVRAPASPVVVDSGVVYVLTNAGALAAIDAYTGDTRWIRRYERVHPLRKPPRSTSTAPRGVRSQFVEAKLPGFANSELVVSDGMIVFAPADGDVILALDASTGEPVWMAGGSSRFAPFKDLRQLVGHNGKDLFFVSRSELVCIGLRSGLRRWMAPLPADQPSWSGRGLVTPDSVILPGPRRLLVFDAHQASSARIVRLPEFALSEDPLSGPFNLFRAGPFLAAVYEGGVEVYSTTMRLVGEASQREDLLESARWFEHAGELRQAADLLVTWLDTEGKDAPGPARHDVTQRLLRISTEVAEATAANGNREAAVALLDRCLPYCGDRELRQRWHLSRLEFWRQIDDMDAYEKEQRALYSFMEGRD